MNITKETISPKKAMQWLKRNVHNRPLSNSTVTSYCRAMRDGAWKLNGDAVRFNGNGDLIDGQHRLAACVKSGCNFDTYVIKGLDHDAFDTIDQGKKRTIGDVFAREGCKNYVRLAAAIRWLWLYRHGAWKWVDPVRPDQANVMLEENPGLHEAVDLASRLNSQQRRMIPPGLLAFLIYETGRENRAMAESFWTSAITGEGISKGQPAYLLHKRLVSNIGATARLRPESIASICIKAWNAFKTKKPCGVLKWSEGEEIPQVIH